MTTFLSLKEIENTRCNRRGGGDVDNRRNAYRMGRERSYGVGIMFPGFRVERVDYDVEGVTIHAQVDGALGSSTELSRTDGRFSA